MSGYVAADILPLNFSFIMNTEKEAKAEVPIELDYITSKANANSWAHSDLRAWLNNGLATSVPDSGTAAPTVKELPPVLVYTPQP